MAETAGGAAEIALHGFTFGLDVDLLVASEYMKDILDSWKKRLLMRHLFHRVTWRAAVRVLEIGACWIEDEATLSN